jgi:hypothetical protein
LGARPLAADPDRDARLLERLRRKAHVAEAIVPAFEARLLVAPQPTQDLELLIGYGPALLEVGPQRLELLDHPSYAQSQDQPPAREMVDRRRDLGPVQRMAVGHHQHAHPERDPLGTGGEIGEARQRLEERQLGRDDEALVRAVGVRRVDPPGRDDPVCGPD